MRIHADSFLALEMLLVANAPELVAVEVTVSWASPPKYPVLLQHGLLPQTDVGNQKLQARARGLPSDPPRAP